jgi:hypothetical protein
MSLLEPQEQSNGLFINPIFDSQQKKWCWSADTTSSSVSSWLVDFSNGNVGCNFYGSYVRGVRSRQ